MKPNRACPICRNSGKVTLLYKQEFLLPDDYKGLPDVYNIVECDNCGFIYSDMIASQAIFDNYYENNSKYENLCLSSSTGGIKDRTKFEVFYNEVEGFINKDFEVLDIGCANGGLLYLLKENGFHKISGIDMSEICVENVSEMGVKCFKGGLFSLPENFIGKFDLVFLTGVLEHIYDIENAMKNICYVLNDSGMVYFDVPDMSKYLDCYIKPFYYFDLEHINHFEKQSLINLGKTHGLHMMESFQKIINGYPCISILLRKGNITTDVQLETDRKAIVNLKKYIEKSYKNDVSNKINELIISQEEIVVWGIGAYTLGLFKKGLEKCNIVAIVDNDTKKQGMIINGIRIESPNVIKNFDATIVILAALFRDEILEQIKEMNISNPIKSIY